MKYRTDRIEVTEHNQKVGYVDWMGGPTISKVYCACPDGRTRWAHVIGEPDTWFSLPAYVNNGSKGRVKGYLTANDGLWEFRAYQDQGEIEWRPTKQEKV